jgi:hypothetical protein
MLVLAAGVLATTACSLRSDNVAQSAPPQATPIEVVSAPPIESTPPVLGVAALPAVIQSPLAALGVTLPPVIQSPLPLLRGVTLPSAVVPAVARSIPLRPLALPTAAPAPSLPPVAVPSSPPLAIPTTAPAVGPVVPLLPPPVLHLPRP